MSVSGGKPQSARESVLPGLPVVPMNLPKPAFIDRCGRILQKLIAQEECRLERHIDAFADQRVGFPRRISNAEQPLPDGSMIPESRAGTQRSDG
jgi:hypothetical protein